MNNKNTNNFMQNMMKQSEHINTGTKSTSRHHTNSRAKLNIHKSDANHANDINNLPWSCTFGLGNISQLDALKFIYHCKNRNDALTLVLNSSHSIQQLVSAKGSTAERQFHTLQQSFLMRHENQAKSHYLKFHHNQSK